MANDPVNRISAPYRVREQKFKNSLKHAMVKFIKEDILHQKWAPRTINTNKYVT